MKKRMDILRKSNVISEITYIKILKIYYKYFCEFEKSDILDSFITHLAISLERVNLGKNIERLDKDIVNELKEQKKYNRIEKMWLEIEKKENIKLPINEKEYIYLHLMNIF